MHGNMIVVPLMALWIGSISPPAPETLLERCEQARRTLLRQIAKSETWMETRDSRASNAPIWAKIDVEFRWDGAAYEATGFGRYEYIRTTWRHLDRRSAPTPPGRAATYRQIWDGNTLYDSMLYAGTEMRDLVTNSIVVDRGAAPHYRRNVSVAYEGSPLNGVLDGDLMSFPAVFREQDEVRLRDMMEPVNGSPCHVLEARGKHGAYTIWIDPARGYNVARAEVIKQGSDWAFGECMTSPIRRKYNVTKFQFTLDNVRLENVGGNWVPMEAEMQRSTEYNAGERTITERRYCKRTSIDLNPDFEAIGAFKPDIPNGTTVYDTGIPGIAFVWQDGQLVPNIEEAVIATINDQVEEMRAENNAASDVQASGILTDHSGVPITAQALLQRYRAGQNRLQSIVAIGRSWGEYGDSHQQTVYCESCSSEVRLDGDRFAHRLIIVDPNAPDNQAARYQSLLWDGETLIQYRDGPHAEDRSIRTWPNSEQKTRLMAAEYRGAPLLGICPGDTDRIDAVLERAEELTVRADSETVRGLTCHVIEGKTASAEYAVWISPNHGYNIAQIHIERKGSTPPGSFLLKDVAFQEIDGVWVPMRGTTRVTEADLTREWRYERLKVTLNPDHNARHSFVPDDIPEHLHP